LDGWSKFGGGRFSPVSAPCLGRLDSAAQMPARLRPTAPIASDAILVGDPGRALLLAQELLRQPKMSNHARGLWGYTGQTEEGSELTIQSTGMGGPSAAVVLADLAELGVRRAVRVGTCTSLGELELGDLVVATEARPERSRGSFRTRTAQEEQREGGVAPDQRLTAALEGALRDEAHRGVVVSLDVLHRPAHEERPGEGEVADMQTAALLGGGQELGVALAAVLIVSHDASGEDLDDKDLAAAAKRAGTAAAIALSPST
jgi:purine-nucleoside phosphorylase